MCATDGKELESSYHALVSSSGGTGRSIFANACVDCNEPAVKYLSSGVYQQARSHALGTPIRSPQAESCKLYQIPMHGQHAAAPRMGERFD